MFTKGSANRIARKDINERLQHVAQSKGENEADYAKFKVLYFTEDRELIFITHYVMSQAEKQKFINYGFSPIELYVNRHTVEFTQYPMSFLSMSKDGTKLRFDGRPGVNSPDQIMDLINNSNLFNTSWDFLGDDEVYIMLSSWDEYVNDFGGGK